MKRPLAFAAIVLLALPLVGDTPDAQSPSLFAQSASAILARDFSDSALSYLLLDARTGRPLASRWEHPEQPIPLGSLLKPFTAMAYGATHDYRFPQYECRGGHACWLPTGHGRLDLVHAVAYSCNAYFRSLAAGVDVARTTDEFRRFGLTPPPPGATPDQLIGLDDTWRLSPLQIAHAYLALAARPWGPGIPLLLEGMADSARFGTGKAVGRSVAGANVLVKTGTAVCTHGNAPGDGFVLALLPADAPRLLLLVRMHAEPGSRASITAGRILRHLQDQTGLPHD